MEERLPRPVLLWVLKVLLHSTPCSKEGRERHPVHTKKSNFQKDNLAWNPDLRCQTIIKTNENSDS